jgi:hypothetical protein
MSVHPSVATTASARPMTEEGRRTCARFDMAGIIGFRPATCSWLGAWLKKTRL